jgi:broad specificity phosphatase PhoE
VSTDPAQQLVDALDAADADATTRARLTTDQLVARTDMDPDAVDELLDRLRFDDRTVARGFGDWWWLRDDV